jgi:hypothetical protein
VTAVPGTFDDDDIRQLIRLLHRYADTELDQWEAWRFATSFGDVFIELRRAPSPGYDAGAYLDMAPWVEEEGS